MNSGSSSSPQSFVKLTNSGGSTPNRFPSSGYHGQSSYDISVPSWVKTRSGSTNVGVELYVKDSKGANIKVDTATINEPWSSCHHDSPKCTSYTVTDDKSGATGHHSYVQVWISGTDNDQNNYHIGYGGSHTFRYHAISQTITITIDRWHNGASNPYDHKVINLDCYHASCSTPSVSGGIGPSGVVMANQQFQVTIPVTNDNLSPDRETIPASVGGYNFSLTEPPENGHGFVANDTNFDLDIGETNYLTVTVTAPSSIQNFTLNFYPDMYGHASISSPNNSGNGNGACSVTVPIYDWFTLKPHATLTYPGTQEYPRTITYSTYIENDGPAAVTAPTTSSFTYAPYSGGTGCPNNGPVNSNGPYNPGSPDYTISPTNCNPSSLAAGDLYCSQITLTSYNHGAVGPGGSVIGDGFDPSASETDQQCVRIVNEPYFKVTGANLSAGGDFSTNGSGTCTGGGLLAGYTDNVDNPERGAGSQLSALALIKITGVASAQGAYPASAPAGTALTFANTNSSDINSNYDSPGLGGNFDPGGSHCLTDQSPSTTSVSKTGPYKLPGKSGITDNESVFVNGDVRVMGNITYGSGWSIDKVPSFVLRATGNIYIDPSVTQLDGTYISDKKVYTCDDNGFSPMPASQMYNSCKNQLVVNGSVTAQHINMQRTFGSLRDERPGAAPPSGSQVNFAWSSAGPISGQRCTQVNEPADPHTWTDNYLCVPTSTSAHLAWTHNSGNPAGCDGLKFTGYTIKGSDPGNASLDCLKTNGYPDCYQWNAVGDPDTWGDNYLCSSSDLGLSFLTAPNDSKYCGTNIIESADPDGQWSSTGYYLCQPPAPPSGLACSNAGTQVDPKSCAAEIFDFSPEIYLSTPAIELPNNGAVQYDAVTSLPPVL